jgi:predicted RNA-binding Zn-ribbon protein involved in translation (DUF1610 family)
LTAALVRRDDSGGTEIREDAAVKPCPTCGAEILPHNFELHVTRCRRNAAYHKVGDLRTLRGRYIYANIGHRSVR